MGLIKDPRDCGNSVWSGQPDAGLAGPLEGLGRCCEQNISRACLEMALPENTGVEQTVQLILQDGPAIVPCHARLRDGAVPGRVHTREMGRWWRRIRLTEHRFVMVSAIRHFANKVSVFR